MFKFKSSGIKINDQKFTDSRENLERLVVPIGIKTPIEIGNDNSELFKMHVDPLEQLADNLRNLIQTNHGERLGRFTLGCNLKSILFSRNSSIENDYQKEVTEAIKLQVERFMPVIVINDITIEGLSKLDNIDNTSLAKVLVKVNFAVPALRRNENSIEVVLYNAG